MAKRRLALSLVAMLATQVFWSLAFGPGRIGAQGTETVYLVRGSRSIADCKVQYETSEFADFRTVNRSDHEACQGGIVRA